MNSEPTPTTGTASSIPFSVAALFADPGQIVTVTPYGGGLINDTFLVHRRHSPPFLLQRLNRQVFNRPELLMDNIRQVGEHLRHKEHSTKIGAELRSIRLLLTHEREDCYYDEEGCCWRAVNFIEQSRTLEGVTSEEQAQAAGAALGRFQALLHDLPPARLHDTLPTLHVIPCALRGYDETVAKTAKTTGAESNFCQNFIERRRDQAAILEQARARGVLPERVIHGDPKLDNILFDRDSDRALALVDLDTVKPGLTQYDVGDCLRSCCNPAGDDPADPEEAKFDLDLARALLSGYLGEMRALLTYSDFAYFYQAVRLISFELGLRFFSDYLAGNHYFKINAPEQNLRRAVTQFHLTASIESRERPMRLIIKELT